MRITSFTSTNYDNISTSIMSFNRSSETSRSTTLTLLVNMICMYFYYNYGWFSLIHGLIHFGAYFIWFFNSIPFTITSFELHQMYWRKFDSEFRVSKKCHLRTPYLDP